MRMLPYKWLFVSALSVCLFEISAQTSTMVGYTYQYFGLETVNEYIANFDENFAEQGDKLKPLHSLNGLNVGIRRKLMDNVALELGYETALNYKKSEFTKFTDEGTPMDIRLNSQFNAFYGGLEFHLDNFGAGAHANYDKTKIKYRNESQNDSRTVVNQNGWGTTIFVSIYLQGSSNTSLIMRPFYRMNFYTLQLSDLAAELDPNQNLSIPTTQDVTAFGMKLIFKNKGN